MAHKPPHWRYKHVTAREHRENVIVLLCLAAVFACWLISELSWHWSL